MNGDAIHTASNFRQKVAAGHNARQNDSSRAGHSRAIEFYREALSLAVTRIEKAEAYGALAVSLRVVGSLYKADTAFKRALSHAEDEDRVLFALIQRDYGALWHEHAVKWRRDQSDYAFNEAERLYNESAIAFADNSELAEEFTSVGFLGLLLIEMGLRSNGRALLRKADAILSNLAKPHPVYETNNLIRRMRVSSLPERLRLLPRALRLTRKGGENSGSRKRVFAALLGNRVYRFVVKRQQRK